MYKKVESVKGVRYLKDGRFIKHTEVPEDIKTELNNLPKPEPQEKVCLFCDQYGKYTRLLNMQTVYLCETDFYDKSIGKIAEKLRSRSK
jgi:hypothetical protein